MSASVGSSIDRKDGHLKVTGQARYAADHPIKNVAHAAIICSTIGKGRIASIDSADAEKAPGFMAIVHHGNAPKMFRPVNNFMTASKPGEIRVVFEDDNVHYSGQYVAVVVAETLQQAQYAANLVKITYETATPAVETEQAMNTAYDPS
jgi:xanthine dehydrogenase YagR molybdenum-binding subunit